MPDGTKEIVSFKTLIKGALLGGLTFFIWTNISWMAIGWHNSYMSAVPNEAAFSESIRNAVPATGLYVIPWHDQSDDWDEVVQKTERGPFGYMMIFPKGKSMSMGSSMIMSLVMNCLLSLLATWLLLQTTGLSFVRRIGFIKTVGLTGSLWFIFANWNWWGFPSGYLIVNVVDAAIAWGLVGLVLAKFVVKS